jgi:hypothetical protein
LFYHITVHPVILEPLPNNLRVIDILIIAHRHHMLTDNQQHKVKTVLDKRTDGDPIFLDWNAFDPSNAIRETELKDIFHRFVGEDGVFLDEPHLQYDDVADVLRTAAEKKKSELLAYAKDKALERMLDECRKIDLVTIGGTPVTNKKTLCLYFKQACRPVHQTNMEAVSQECFKETTCWHSDLSVDMREKFGIEYDPKTVRVHKNRKGNGFIEKIITRAVCNMRQDLHGANERAEAEVPAPRVKRSAEEAYADDGTYDRARRNGKKKHAPRKQQEQESQSPERRTSPRTKRQEHESPQLFSSSEKHEKVTTLLRCFANFFLLTICFLD